MKYNIVNFMGKAKMVEVYVEWLKRKCPKLATPKKIRELVEQQIELLGG